MYIFDSFFFPFFTDRMIFEVKLKLADRPKVTIELRNQVNYIFFHDIFEKRYSEIEKILCSAINEKRRLKMAARFSFVSFFFAITKKSIILLFFICKTNPYEYTNTIYYSKLSILNL